MDACGGWGEGEGAEVGDCGPGDGACCAAGAGFVGAGLGVEVGVEVGGRA